MKSYEYQSLCCQSQMEPEQGHCPSCGQNAEPTLIEFEDEDGAPVAMVVDDSGIIRELESAAIKAIGLACLAGYVMAWTTILIFG